MKKTWALVLTAAVAAMTLGMASPAKADCSGNIPSLPESNTVWLENGQIRINPNGAGADVAQYRAYVVARVLEVVDCVTDLLPAEVWCLEGKVLEILGDLDPANLDLRYVYHDPSTGDIVIDYSLLVDDAADCLN